MAHLIKIVIILTTKTVSSLKAGASEQKKQTIFGRQLKISASCPSIHKHNDIWAKFEKSSTFQHVRIATRCTRKARANGQQLNLNQRKCILQVNYYNN